MNKASLNRIFFYTIGLLILAMGLTLNTKANLGVSPIISIPYCFSQIFHLNFGNATLVLYCIFVVIEILLHLLGGKRSSPQRKNNERFVLIIDLLQIPLSIVFTRFMNIFSAMLPDLPAGSDNTGLFLLQLAILAAAIVFTGIGASLSLSMRLVPNPGDGMVQTLADCTNQSVGTTKNCFDLFNISITICIGLFLQGHLIGIGIGTLLAVIGVGRTIAFFQHFTQDKINALSGLSHY